MFYKLLNQARSYEKFYKLLKQARSYEKVLETFKAKKSKVSKQGFWKMSCKREFYKFEIFLEKENIL